MQAGGRGMGCQAGRVDRDSGWWAEAVFAGWRQRPGPRYQRLAAALLDAVQRRVVGAGARVPAERTLAAALGVSRGTMVACFEHLVAAGVLARRQGAGTYVLGRPSWASNAGGVATLLRRAADDLAGIDLSMSVPGDLRHLPAVDAAAAWAALDGHGLDPAGLPSLRAEVAAHLTRHQGLPTDPEQLVITAGAQEALWLLGRALAPGTDLVTTCPTYPGLTGAFAGTGRRVVALPTGPAGPDPSTLERAARAPGTVVYLMPTGHNPTGTVLPTLARQAIAAVADAGRATIVEDLALADLLLDGDLAGPPPPLAALSTRVVAVGSVAKLLWGGLRVGWVRADEPLRRAVLAQKVAANLATSTITQALTARLLAGIGPGWLAGHRAALTRRRDHFAAELAARLPGWRIGSPAAGLSLWAQLPVRDADAFGYVAARHGVTVSPGSAACVEGRHRHCVRLSFVEQPDTLTLAADRLAAAWEMHTQDLAAAPARSG